MNTNEYEEPKETPTMPYAKGESFTCPHCGRESVVDTRPRMDGWTVLGTDLVCAICESVLAPADEPEANEADAPEAANTDAAARTAALELLATEAETGPDAGDVLGDRREAHFCRDCVHYIKHPFGARCAVWGRRVDPMNDCPRFERASEADDGTA